MQSMVLSSLNRSPEARGSSLSTCDQHHQHSSNSISIITLNLVHDKSSDHPSNNSKAKSDQDCQELAQCLLVVIVMMMMTTMMMKVASVDFYEHGWRWWRTWDLPSRGAPIFQSRENLVEAEKVFIIFLAKPTWTYTPVLQLLMCVSITKIGIMWISYVGTYCTTL